MRKRLPFRADSVRVRDLGVAEHRVVAVVAVSLGLLIGFFAWWAFLNIGGAGAVFIVGWVGGAAWLWRRELATDAFGLGLYVVALEMIAVPVLFYVPTILGASDTGGFAGAGEFIGGILGLVIWEIVFGVFAVIEFAIGYFARKRAANKRSGAE